MTLALEARNLRVGYGLSEVLHGVDVTVGQGEICGVLGPNGAGKTTMMQALSGVLPSEGITVSQGTVILGDSRLRAPYRPETAFNAGIVLVQDRRNIFGAMTIEENLRLAGTSRPRKQLHDELDFVYDLFPILAEHRGRRGALLSGGQRQMLAVGCGLMCDARVLLLDEISTGVAPVLVQQILTGVSRLRTERGMSILMAEQTAAGVLAHADRCIVMRSGEVVLDGSPDDVRQSEFLLELYTG